MIALALCVLVTLASAGFALWAYLRAERLRRHLITQLQTPSNWLDLHNEVCRERQALIEEIARMKGKESEKPVIGSAYSGTYG